MTASTAKQEVNRMPRGTHPNSLANLKKGHRFSSADDSARENAKKASSERRSIAEEMKALLDEPNKDGSTRRKALAAKLVLNMDKSPEWYKLGLRMIGELPPEQIDVKSTTLSDEAKAEIDKLLEETKGDVR